MLMGEDEKEQAERLKRWLASKFGSSKAAAIALGKSVNYFSEYLRKGRLPNVLILRELEREHGLDLLFIDKGEDSALAREPSNKYLADSVAAKMSYSSAREMYEDMEFHPGKPKYDDLEDWQREDFEFWFQEYHLRLKEIEADKIKAGAALDRRLLTIMVGERPPKTQSF